MKEASDKATDKVSKIIYEVFESLNSNSFAALGRPDAAV